MAEYLTGTLQHARHVGVVFQNADLQSMWQSVEQGRQEHKQLRSGRRRAAGGGWHAVAKILQEFLAAPVDAKACGTVSSSGATSFAACGDGLSERGASEPVAECPTGTQELSRHVGDGSPE